MQDLKNAITGLRDLVNAAHGGVSRVRTECKVYEQGEVLEAVEIIGDLLTDIIDDLETIHSKVGGEVKDYSIYKDYYANHCAVYDIVASTRLGEPPREYAELLELYAQKWDTLSIKSKESFLFFFWREESEL